MFSGAIVLMNFKDIFGYATGTAVKTDKFVTKEEIISLNRNIAEKFAETYEVMSYKNTVQNGEIQNCKDFKVTVFDKLSKLDKIEKLLTLVVKHSEKSREILEEYQLNNLITSER
jgi:hypothetical protein